MPSITAQLPAPFPRIFEFAPGFLATRAWAVLVLWLGGLALLTAVLSKGRWTRATRRMEIGFSVAWLVVLGWLIASQIFVQPATDEGAKFALVLVVITVVIDLGVKLFRMRPGLHAPKVAARH